VQEDYWMLKVEVWRAAGRVAVYATAKLKRIGVMNDNEAPHNAQSFLSSSLHIPSLPVNDNSNDNKQKITVSDRYISSSSSSQSSSSSVAVNLLVSLDPRIADVESLVKWVCADPRFSTGDTLTYMCRRLLRRPATNGPVEGGNAGLSWLRNVKRNRLSDANLDIAGLVHCVGEYPLADVGVTWVLQEFLKVPRNFAQSLYESNNLGNSKTDAKGNTTATKEEEQGGKERKSRNVGAGAGEQNKKIVKEHLYDYAEVSEEE
jgi:hypothetical protein